MAKTSVEMLVETLNEMQILQVEQAIDLESPMQGVYAVQYAPGLMYVDSINNPPYIVQLPNTLYRFAYKPANSGTAKLEARMQARLYFEALKDAKT